MSMSVRRVPSRVIVVAASVSGGSPESTHPTQFTPSVPLRPVAAVGDGANLARDVPISHARMPRSAAVVSGIALPEYSSRLPRGSM